MKIFTFLIFCSTITFAQNSKLVNVFIGTDGTGHTFPGPSMPFGMVQPGPDNKDYGWDHTSGYQYNDTILLIPVGFVHQIKTADRVVNQRKPVHHCPEMYIDEMPLFLSR